jgi:hypothetical protein
MQSCAATTLYAEIAKAVHRNALNSLSPEGRGSG